MRWFSVLPKRPRKPGKPPHQSRLRRASFPSKGSPWQVRQGIGSATTSLVGRGLPDAPPVFHLHPPWGTPSRPRRCRRRSDLEHGKTLCRPVAATFMGMRFFQADEQNGTSPQGPAPSLFLLASRTVFFFSQEKENGLGPARAARPSGPGGSHKAVPNRRTQRRRALQSPRRSSSKAMNCLATRGVRPGWRSSHFRARSSSSRGSSSRP